MNLRKAFAARQRGIRARKRTIDEPNRFFGHIFHKKYLRHCLNLILLVCTTSKLLFCIDVGWHQKYQSTSEGSTLCLASVFVDVPPYFSDHSQSCACFNLLALCSLTSFAWTYSKVITAAGQRILKPARQPTRQVQDYDHTTKLLDQIILGLTLITLVALTVLHIRGIGAHPWRPDFCLDQGHHLYFQFQEVKKRNYALLASILITPVSRPQYNLEAKIGKIFSIGFDISATLAMDPPASNDRGIYKQMNYRLAESEAAESGGGASNTRESLSTLVDSTEDAAAARSYPHRAAEIRWAPELEQRPRSTEPFIRRQLKADDISRVLDDTDFGRSHLTSPPPISLPAGENDSRYPIQSESIVASSTGRRGLRLRKARSRVFSQDGADTGFPTPLPPKIRLRKKISTIFGHNSSSKPTENNHSGEISREDTTFRPQLLAVSNLRRVRNLEMEEACRQLGMPVPGNRFGLEEVVSDPSATGDMSCLEIAREYSLIENSDDSVSTSAEINILSHTEDGKTLMEDEEVHSPIAETDVFTAESDPLAWLKNSFQPTQQNLLKNFGTPPKDTSAPSAPTKDKLPPPSLTTPTRNRPSSNASHLGGSAAVPIMGDLGTCEAEPARPLSRDVSHQNYILEIQILQGRVEELLEEVRVLNEARQGEVKRVKDLEDEIERLRGREQQLTDELEFHMTKEVEMYNVRAGEAAALEKLKIAEMKLKLYENDFEGIEDSSAQEANFGFSTTTYGTQQNPGAAIFPSTSKDRNSNQSSEKQSSRKKAKSQEGGFFSRIFGAKEPSLDALNELRKKTFAEANVNEGDPDAAAKLKVSSKKLPPEAPKPASKDPVPKVPGDMSKLRRFSSFDNLKRKDTKDTGTLESRMDSNLNASRNSQVVNLNAQSLTFITEESSKGSKSPQYGTRPSSFTNDSHRSEEVSLGRVDRGQVPYGGLSNSSDIGSPGLPATPRSTNQRPTAAYDYDRPSLARIYQEASMDSIDNGDVTGYMTLEGKPHHYSKPGSGPSVLQHRRTHEIFSEADLFTKRSQHSENPAIPQGWDYDRVSRPDRTALSGKCGYQAPKQKQSPKRDEQSTISEPVSENHPDHRDMGKEEDEADEN